jgi:hypothetical protein
MSNVLYENVDGAPFCIGAKVTVKKLTDETGNKEFLGKTGKIVYYSYDGACGEIFPHEPIMDVGFEGEKLDQYWPEELESLADEQ